jgi:GT2 family glycosyltransferase
MKVNRGPASSRNAAARLANAEILAFTDSDCRPDPRWLEEGIAALRDESVVFVTGAIFHKPEQKVLFFTRSHDPVTVEIASYPTMNIFYRKRVFFEFDGFAENVGLRDFRGRVVDCSDCDLAWRIKEAGRKNVFVPEMIIYHERESLPKLSWMLIPIEQCIVPLLVKRHPNARPHLLYRSYFFNFLNIPFYLLCLGILLAVLFQNPWFLVLMLPYPAILARACRRRWSPSPLETLAWVFLLTCRQALLCGALIFGSVRFRCLVL